MTDMDASFLVGIARRNHRTSPDAGRWKDGAAVLSSRRQAGKNLRLAAQTICD
jgi:hypothetical protein